MKSLWKRFYSSNSLKDSFNSFFESFNINWNRYESISVFCWLWFCVSLSMRLYSKTRRFEIFAKLKSNGVPSKRQCRLKLEQWGLSCSCSCRSCFSTILNEAMLFQRKGCENWKTVEWYAVDWLVSQLFTKAHSSPMSSWFTFTFVEANDYFERLVHNFSTTRKHNVQVHFCWCSLFS